MGQVRGRTAKLDACNLRSLSSFGVPAAGQHILVSTDNSAMQNGQGNFDAYVVGDGRTAATELPKMKINQDILDLVNSFHVKKESDEYTELLLDSENKILESRNVAGEKTFNTNAFFSKDVNVNGKTRTKELSLHEDSYKIICEDNTLYAYAILDAENKVVFGIKQDGSVVIPKMNGNSNNVLYGKKWAVCGDSFTNGSPTLPLIQNGLYAGQRQTYGWLIGNRNGMVIQHMAVGGRTIATPASISVHNCFTDTSSSLNYTQIAEDVDYITLYFGINDSSNAPSGQGGDGETPVGKIPLGELTDTTPNTFCGAWNFVLPYLIEHHPFAHIGIIITNGITSNTNYSDATKSLAEKWGIPYIDMNGDERTPFMIRSNNPNIPQSIKDIRNVAQAVNWGTDNHPNADAHLFESYFIENFLRSI